MLSVKHIHPNGSEEIMPAKYVRYEPKQESPPDAPPSLAACVWICAPDGHEHGCHWGSFFVMNDHGKTVARYDLGG